MKIVPMTGVLGAEIFDADPAKDGHFDQIRQAFADHGVITLRGLSLTPDDHLAFARRWGPINVNRFFQALESHPEIAVVLKEPEQTKAIGEVWHTDHSYDVEPAMGSILHAIETPLTGGDTVFCSMAAAYDALSERFKALLAGLSAWHSSRHVFGASQSQTEQSKSGRISNAAAATQDALHPIVIRHPLSGRASLYVNPQFTTRIDGLTEAESDAILQMLYAHCQRPEFQCRVRWRPGDMTMWDNRATWHKAINDYPGQRRYMHRITVEGCALAPA